VRTALRSLLNQTFKDFELVIVDDASTDDSFSILKSFERRDDRVRVIRNRENLGIARSLNVGLEVCGAPLVARADADDVYEPERLTRQIEFMHRKSNVGLLSSNVYIIDQKSQVIDRTQYPETHEEIRFCMNYTCPISHPAVMLRREILESAGGYDPKFSWVEDVELWNRLVRRTRFANLANPLVRYRRHNKSVTSKRPQSGDQSFLEIRRDLLADYLGEEVSLNEADALHLLLRQKSSKHSEVIVRRGIRIGKSLQEELQYRGHDQLRYEFADEFFDAICSQSVKHSSSNRLFSWRLLSEAIRTSPPQMGRVEGLKKIAAMIRG
jgi:glycosyltransferase involved in cell wall biosynthesis